MKYDINYLYKLEKLGLLDTNRCDDLIIFDYSRKCQYEYSWDEYPILLNCRGLVLNHEGDVVCYTTPKFFNYNEKNAKHITNENFEIYEKLDGSLGILFYHNDKWYFNTRGSFRSEQAIEFNKIFFENYDINILNKDLSYMFEIIYKENCIVIDYGDLRDCILITSYQKDGIERLDELERLKNKISIVCKYKFFNINNDLFNQLQKADLKNKEGYVVRYESGYRLKIKYDTYIRLHYISNHFTIKNIWEILQKDENIEDYISGVPDELYGLIQNKVNEFTTKYSELEKYCYDEYNYLLSIFPFEINEQNKNLLAVFIKKENGISKSFLPILFGILNKKEYQIKKCIWSILRPKSDEKII